jgi:NAD(P)-dependent dehydrogenase (short-subunit alcohol dehydrogenase family)
MPIALITGSGKRIGKSLALEFANKGWNVAVHYNTSREGALDTISRAESCGVRTALLKADLRNKKEIDSALEQMVDILGVPEVLVNNAGVFPERMEMDNITEEFWDNALNTNLRSAFYVSQSFAKYAAKGARIINIASLGGIEIWKHRLPYNVSKSGLIQLTRAMSRELAPDISVNAVCPGAVYFDEEPDIKDLNIIDITKIPKGRLAKPEDIFDAVYFFATCTDYITGQILVVDGGYHYGR